MQHSSKIEVHIIQNTEDSRASRHIRELVFVEEQSVDPKIEYDEFETISTHVLALYNGLAVGTARWRKTDSGYKLERFAVLPTARKRGVGQALVMFIMDQIEVGFPVYLNSQVSAIEFYKKLGFQAEGEIFYEADIPHRKMIYQV